MAEQGNYRGGGYLTAQLSKVVERIISQLFTELVPELDLVGKINLLI